jgi:hypothetical protein
MVNQSLFIKFCTEVRENSKNVLTYYIINRIATKHN